MVASEGQGGLGIAGLGLLFQLLDVLRAGHQGEHGEGKK